MKVNLTLDKDNYVLSLFSDENGEYEVDDNIDLTYLHCYRLIDNQLVLDETKVIEVIKQIEINAEISELEQLLNNSDYIIARVFEEVMSLNNPLTFIADLLKIFIKYKDKYKEQLANRVEWRERIEELRK